MKKMLTKTMTILLSCSFLASNITFAESVAVRFSGKSEPESMVSFMVVGKDADVSNPQADDLYVVDIKKTDENGNFFKTIKFDESAIDAQGNLADYKVVSNIELTQQILGDIFYFESFTVSPVEENGVLYVPIEETLDLIGGETVSYTYNKETKTYTGDANNGEFIIVMGKDTVEVDWVDIELPGILKEINGTNMMPAYAIKYVLKTGDVMFTPGERVFKLTDGVKKANFDWNKNEIESRIDQLVDEKTRVVVDTAKDCGSLYAYDWREDGSTIKRNRNASEWGDVYTIENIPDTGTTGGYEVAIVIDSSDDNDTVFENDHVGVFHFKARTIYTNDESGTAPFQIALQRRAAGDNTIMQYSTALSEQVGVPYEYTDGEQEWKDYYFVVDSGTTELLDGSWIKIVPIGNAAKFEICDIQLWDFGIRADCADKLELLKPHDGYKGIEDDHVWRQEAWNRIDKYRKEDISVEVVDESGNPVPNAIIDVRMTENEFMFGAAICENETLDEYLDLNTKRGQTLDSFMDNDMNTGVVADNLKAPGVIGPDASSGIKMVNEFISRGKRTRGHALYWDKETLMPFNRSKEMTYQEIYKQTMDYIRPLVYTCKGSLVQWDVLNEPHDSNNVRLKYNTTRLYTDVFKEVKKIDPDVKLYVNETGMEGRPYKGYEDRVPNFLNIVKQMQTQGAQIDGIGIQAHCTNYYYPQGFYHQIDECAQVVDEVSITEYDFYNGNTEYAPNHLEDTLLATFSHPKTTAFIVWGIEDSMHWRWNAECAPFFDRDWNKKPAYDMWLKLINQDFATNTTLTTDTEGKASVRAFRGDYEITCTYNGKTRTIPLGNTVDGGSSVKFVVGNTINATASNGAREQLKPIKFNNMTEAKKELDSITEHYYKGVILDRNFKGVEDSSLVNNGGDLLNNSDYQAGIAWGSYSGNTDILHGGDWGSTIIHANGAAQSGEIRLKAEGTERYENTGLHHETMFYTLDADVSGEMIIHTGISKVGNAENDLMLAQIIYEDGEYTIETWDSQIIKLNKNSFYTLDTAIAGDTILYTLYLSDEVVYEHSYKFRTAIDTTEYDEVVYMLDATCNEGDIFKLHNARLFEYKDGELIEFSDTDYEAYVLDESMRDFDVSMVQHAGSSFSSAPEEWSHIGSSDSISGFGYSKNQYFGAVAHDAKVNEHSVAKGFGKIEDGESIEITFDAFIGSYDKWMNKTGRGELSIGSHDKSVMLDVAQFRYRQYNDANGGPFDLWLLDVNDTGVPANKTAIGHNSLFARGRTDVKLILKPSTDGQTYDANISVKPRFGTEEIVADASGILTKEQVKSLDTLFISSYTESGTTSYSGQMMFGVKDVKIRKYGKTMYKNGEASISSGNSAALGIMYNNVTQVYKDAAVIVAGYNDNNSLVYCDVKKYTMNPGRGAFDFNIDNQADGAVKYRVFLVEGTDSIIPYKSDDVITIK